MRLRTKLGVVSAGALVAGLGLATPAYADTPVCRGQLATGFLDAPGTLVGTAGPDVLVGSTGDDTIRALDGDDLVCTGGGADHVNGGGGADDIFATGPSPTVLRGGDGDDLI